MDLLRNYPEGYNVLPTANPHDVVNVSLQLALYHLVDMVHVQLSDHETLLCLERASPDPDYQLRDHHQGSIFLLLQLLFTFNRLVARRVPDVGPGGLRQHHRHSSTLGEGLDTGHRPLQRRGGRRAGSVVSYQEEGFSFHFPPD